MILLTIKAIWLKPIHVNYRQYTAYNLPPNTQGMESLEILNILNNFNVKSLREGRSDYYHLIIETNKQAFADCDKYLTGRDVNKILLDLLLSNGHSEDKSK